MKKIMSIVLALVCLVTLFTTSLSSATAEDADVIDVCGETVVFFRGNLLEDGSTVPFNGDRLVIDFASAVENVYRVEFSIFDIYKDGKLVPSWSWDDPLELELVQEDAPTTLVEVKVFDVACGGAHVATHHYQVDWSRHTVTFTTVAYGPV